MDVPFATIAMSTASMVLSYAAAFFFIVVAAAAAYALVKAGKALERVDKVLADVDQEGVPLMRKAGTSLDGINANLGNVDQITKDVADITDKVEKMTTAVEGAVSTPARKAAAFSAGVQSAVSSFMRRDKDGSGPAAEPAADAAASAGAGWTYAAADNVASGDSGVTAEAMAEPSAGADAEAPASEA